MKILILSDSHSEPIKLIFNEFDTVIHCGDYGKSFDLLENSNAYYVRGNCDLRGDYENFCYKFNKKILIVHGHLYNVKMSLDRLVYKSLELNVSLCCFGHTHFPTFFKEEHTYFLNPGAYEDGYYAVLCDSKVTFYLNGKIIKEQEIKW